MFCTAVALVLTFATTHIVQGEEPNPTQSRNRIVRVVTVPQDGLKPSADSFTEETIERLDLAASFRSRRSIPI